MINILALVPDEQAPSCRFRVRQFTGPLAGEGIGLEIREIPRGAATRRNLLASAAGFPAVILHRKLLRRADFRRLRSSARRLIYDVDDAVIFRDSNASRFDSRRRRRRFRRLAEGADLVLAGNEYLSRQASSAGVRAEVFPTVVDTGSFLPRTPDRVRPVIGWMGTSSNFLYLSLILNPIRLLLREHPEIAFRVVADRPPDLPGLPVDYRQWSRSGEAAELAGFSVGVMPLFDDPWTRGKCALKLLQYGAASLPSVASPVGANRAVVREGETGYFARTGEEWRNRLEELLGSPEKGEEMGHAARRLVEERYSLAAAAPRLARIIRRVSGD